MQLKIDVTVNSHGLHPSLFDHYCLQLKHPFTQQMLIKEQYVSATMLGAAYVMAGKTDMASALLGLMIH